MSHKNNAHKIVVFIISILQVAVVTLLYFLDDSLEWGGLKIISCIIVDWWIFFLIPAFVYICLKLKNMSFEKSLAIGAFIGFNIMLVILIAPYFGAKYYFQAKE